IGITGGNGFLGNNTVGYLANKGYRIKSFDRGYSRLFKHDNIEWVEMDLNFSKPKDFEGLRKIVHFAGSYNAENAFEKNVEMLNNTLKPVSKNPDLTVYLISTYAVFGDRNTPANANSPHAPLDEYSTSKSIAEREFQNFLSSNKNQGIIIRPCTLYGKYGRNFVDVIVEKVKRKEKIDMVHFRNQFLNVLDFCKGLEDIINLKNPESSYNIEGEIITEKELSNIFDILGINYSINEKKFRSYWCEGMKLHKENDLLNYLKSQLENAI
ncbi:MAG: NAD(P)-dependent oxidoreductase, partial [Candidatus Pacearchaeota archaeon]|nr:NAD(P)-dependent oxidoreductase [Candidatus Pacearchaeota archaeon]